MGTALLLVRWNMSLKILFIMGGQPASISAYKLWIYIDKRLEQSLCVPVCLVGWLVSCPSVSEFESAITCDYKSPTIY